MNYELKKLSIYSDRLLLRLFTDADAEALFALASDPDVGPRAGWKPHQSVEESRQIIRTVFHNPTTWAIVLRQTGELVGAIGYGPSCECQLPGIALRAHRGLLGGQALLEPRHLLRSAPHDD